MKVESNSWQVIDTLVYQLFTDQSGHRCNKFTIQFSSERGVDIEETKELALRVAAYLNMETPG